MRNRLIELRKEKGLTQSNIAEILKITKSAVSKYESGDREMSFDTVKTLSSLFNVSSDYLLGLSDIRNPKEEIEKMKNDSSLPTEFEYALFGEVKNLSEEQKKDLMKFIAFLKVKDKKNEND